MFEQRLLCYWGRDPRVGQHDHEMVEVIGRDENRAAIRFSDGSFAAVGSEADLIDAVADLDEANE